VHSGEREEFVCHLCHRSLTTNAKLQSHLLSHAVKATKKEAEAGASVSLNDLPVLTEAKTEVEVPSPVSAGEEIVKEESSDEEVSASEGLLKTSVREAILCPHVGCTKAFWSKSGLNQHLRTHSDERSFRCGECSATFTSRSALTQHSVVHTSPSSSSSSVVFSCEWCGACFNRRGNWERHCALGVCAPSNLDNLMAAPLTSPSSSSSAPLVDLSFPSLANESPASTITEYGDSSPIESVVTSFDFGSATPASVFGDETPYSDATPAWNSPDFDTLSDASSSPATEYTGGEEISAVLASIPSAQTLIGDALYDPNAPSSSLWDELEPIPEIPIA
jgi:hypothetical protein